MPSSWFPWHLQGTGNLGFESREFSIDRGKMPLVLCWNRHADYVTASNTFPTGGGFDWHFMGLITLENNTKNAKRSSRWKYEHGILSLLNQKMAFCSPSLKKLPGQGVLLTWLRMISFPCVLQSFRVPRDSNTTQFCPQNLSLDTHADFWSSK